MQEFIPVENKVEFVIKLKPMKKILLLLIAVSFINCAGGDDDGFDPPLEITEKIFNGSAYLSSQQEVDDFGANDYTHINGDLYITNINEDITNLDAFISLRVVQEHLILDYTDIDNLDGLNNLEYVGKGFDIRGAHNLLNVNALSNLKDGGFLAISGTLLKDLEGLNNLQFTEGLSLQDNSNLENIDALSSVKNMFGYINIQRNNSLKNIDGLRSVTIASGYHIRDNKALLNIDGLSNIVSLNGSVTIHSNPELVNIQGLYNLTSIGASCRISQNNKLTNLEGLNNLSHVEEDLVINGRSLTDFCALQPSLISNTQECYLSSDLFLITPQDIIDGNCSQ